MTVAAGATSGGRELALAAQVAAALVEGAAGEVETSTPQLGDLAQAPHFRGPLRRAGARSAALADLPLDAGFMGRLRERPETRLCALLVGQPVAAVREAALRIAAAVLHRGLIGILLKSDRDRLKSMLGEDAFAIAMQEALLLDAPLVQLGVGEAPLEVGDLAALRERLATCGAVALVRFTTLVEPALADGVARRLPEASASVARGLQVMGERHCVHVVKLLRRRGPGWATLIA